MKTDALVQFPWPHLIVLPLLIFFGFFVGVLIWTNLKSNKSRYAALRLIPLEGEADEKR
jgi:hypothetical protein